MSMSDLLRAQFDGAHEWLEGTVEGLTREQAHWQPQGNVVPIAAHYAHIVIGEDMFLSPYLGVDTSVAEAQYGGQIGVTEMPPQGPWAEWAERVEVDLPTFREYARAVYQSTDAALGRLSDADLERQLDLSDMGMGESPLTALISLMLTNVNLHCGEISCIKGLQGLKGYPM